MPKIETYHLLEEEFKCECVANFLHAQEQDHYLHTVNKARYEKMLATMSDGKFKDRIQRLLDETNERIEEVSHIIQASREDFPDVESLKVARQRVVARSVKP